jgi:isoleucyl-tRNA synthetase
VQWTPPTGRNRLHSMIEARPDWVLSRQRAWGVPLTCFVKKGAKPTDPDFLLRDPEVNARIVAAFEAEGADVWYVPRLQGAVLAGCMTPTPTSRFLTFWMCGSTQRLDPCLRPARPRGRRRGRDRRPLSGRHRPAPRLVPFLDAAGLRDQGPRALSGVLTHGFTLDEKGMKMSKSLGNTVAPQEVIDEYGADILRLWVAQSDYTADLRIGKEILKGTADSYRRLRNTLRFLLGSLADLGRRPSGCPAEMPELERWVLHRLAELDGEVREGYAAYDFQGVFQAVFTFARRTCRPSISMSARMRFIATATAPAAGPALTVLDALFHRLTTWLAPMLVFTMEDVWLSRFPGEDPRCICRTSPKRRGLARRRAGGEMGGCGGVRRVVTGALEVQRRGQGHRRQLEAAPVVHVDAGHGGAARHGFRRCLHHLGMR